MGEQGSALLFARHVLDSLAESHPDWAGVLQCVLEMQRETVCHASCCSLCEVVRRTTETNQTGILMVQNPHAEVHDLTQILKLHWQSTFLDDGLSEKKAQGQGKRIGGQKNRLGVRKKVQGLKKGRG